MKNVYEADASVSICILLRDAIESKVLQPDEYPKQLKDPSIKYMIDGVIQVKNLKSVEAAHAKLQNASPIIKYFQEKVRQINKQAGSAKFTRKQYLESFLNTEINAEKIKLKRITENLKLSKDFIEEVNNLKDDVFKESGLPSLRIKDQVRKINLALRNLESPNEDLKEQVDLEKNFKDQLASLK